MNKNNILTNSGSFW